MLSVAIIDANEKANVAWKGLAASVVAGWLRWEIDRAGLTLADPRTADVVLLAYAGALDWRANCTAYLRRFGIEPRAERRVRRPYIVAGGPCDAIPLTVLDVADAVGVGEGYNLVRMLLYRVRSGESVDEIDGWLTEYQHAITRRQTVDLTRDAAAPWLLSEPAPVLAEPDPYVEWDMPPVRSDDGVVRIVASKGCHLKCAFCATTYRQGYRADNDGDRVLRRVKGLVAAGERVQLLSNDPANLPYFRRVVGDLDSESFTILEVGDPGNRAAIKRSHIKISRFGVEGISERIRRAFGKAITDDQILEILADLHGAGRNTHMFFIPGAPYEQERDWVEFRVFYERLTRTIRNGICRVKFTKFLPTPPAPLARFVADLSYELRLADTSAWISGNAASRHILYVAPRLAKTHALNVAEQLSVSLPVAQSLLTGGRQGAVDLAPTVEDAARLPWEVVRWPIAPHLRWKVGEVYRDRMLSGSAPARSLSRLAP